MNLKVLNIFNVLCCLLLFCVFSSCITIKPIEINHIDNIKVLNVISNPEITFDLHVKNPNKFGVKIMRMNLGLYNGDMKLVDVNLIKKSKIRRAETVDLPVSMKPSVEAINSLLKSEMNNLVRGKVNKPMELRGEITMRKFLIRKRIKLKEPIRF